MRIVEKYRSFFAIIGTLVILINIPMKISAAESVALPTVVADEDIIAVDLPSLREGEESPFNFIIDPQQLIFETDAQAYGGGSVEEGANLLFHNRTEGEYDFSRYSDKLTVVNRSTVPVLVTISACIVDVEDIEIVQDKGFSEDGSPYVYLALVDDEGNEQPVSEEGEVSMSIEMRRAPEGAYAYTLNPETGDYEYGLPQPAEEAGFDTYSFGLVGECSSDADWDSISVHPRITVTWHVEPILTEKEPEGEEGTEEKEQLRQRLQENTASEAGRNEDIKSEGISGENTAGEDIADTDSTEEDAVETDIKGERTAGKDFANNETTDNEATNKDPAKRDISEKGSKVFEGVE